MKLRIGLLHQTVWIGDAIGNDIVGAYELLTRCGFEVSIHCQYVHPEVKARCRVLSGPQCLDAGAELDAVIYHHSVCWDEGEVFLRGYPGKVVVKYHNITPEEFFRPYAELHHAKCSEGRRQTVRLLGMPGITHWQCDSEYSASELRELGLAPAKATVVPPFMRIDGLLRETPERTYPLAGPFEALFVGRRAPNKGHAHVIRTLAAWRELFPEVALRCTIVGSVDGHLSSYYGELAALQEELGVGDAIRWLEHVSDAELDGLFRVSHVYLNMSEHEGFCVPLVECQALGLPVVSTNVTALAETAGPSQMLVPVPGGPGDYDFVAGVVHEICRSHGLREHLVRIGFANAYYRFAREKLEDRFMEDMAPVLESFPQ